ncbi:hypothetical protein DIPPA_16612 [Diplonema papillatum]|nr:hypothetical protein DIPPA_16612 [Diplonema papillatum]
MPIEVSAAGAVANEDLEGLLVVLEGLSGFDRVAEVEHSVLTRNPRGQEIRLTRRATGATAADDLNAAPWKLTQLGQLYPEVHPVNVRTTNSTTLPQVPASTVGPPQGGKVGNCDYVNAFLQHTGGFVCVAEHLKVGWHVPMEGGVVVRCFALHAVSPASHALTRARRMAPEEHLVVASVSATQAEQQVFGKSLDVLLSRMAAVVDSVAHLVALGAYGK